MSADDTVQVVAWVLIDENGDYVADDDADKLAERYDEVIGGDRDTLNMRRVRVTLTVPKPRPAELVGVVAPEPTGGELKAV
jgi:hypothetical protein